MTRATRTWLLALAILLVTASAAHAQGPAYTASAPTTGALYTDGQSGRYLLGGAWLFRADLTDVGLSQRLVAQTSPRPTAGPRSTVPNAYNAGNFTQASMNGYVGWYRRDFTLPSGAFASYVQAPDRRWIIRFESVNYRATVWLNGRKIGSHAGAYLPWELDLTELHAGRQPADRARRQPPQQVRPAARARRRLVQLRRHHARGVPARGPARGHLPGADPADLAVPDVLGDDRGAGGYPQRHIHARRSGCEASTARPSSISGRRRSRRTRPGRRPPRR